MSNKPLTLTPGPVSPSNAVLEAYQKKYISPRLDSGFWECYSRVQTYLQTIMQTKNQIPVLSGEGMLVLWGGLKSIIKPGDKIVSLVNGIYGDGIATIAENLGAEVTRVKFAYNGSDFDLSVFEQIIANIQPKMITAVHCDTPTGLLNPIEKIASIKRHHNIPLFYVDAIASVGGIPVNVDENHIDICLCSTPKAMSCVADLCFVSVSDAAWQFMEEKDYRLGYDALLPYKDIQSAFDFPSMPNWPAMAALCKACELIVEQGLNNFYEKHITCMQYTHEQLQLLGYQVYLQNKALFSPTVTAVKLPGTQKWDEFNQYLNERDLQVGSGIGILHNEIFRIGHMGNQADLGLLEQAFVILKSYTHRT